MASLNYFYQILRIAQEYFLQAGISLVLNVKSTIMDKLCRFLQADPMYSIEDMVNLSSLKILKVTYI